MRFGAACIAWTVVVVTAGCSFSGAPPTIGSSDDAGVDAPPRSAVATRRALDVMPPPIATEVIDIPVAIRLAASEHFRDNAQDDGSDIFVTDNNGDVLAHEIERLNVGAGSLLAWVIVPSVPPEGTTLFLHYGGESLAPPTVNIWNGLARLVWHLSAIEAGVVSDSAPSGNDGQRAGAGTIEPVAGILGDAMRFDRAALMVADAARLEASDASFTLAMWVKQVAVIGDDDSGFYKGGPIAARTGYQISLGAGVWEGGVRDRDAVGQERATITFGPESELRSDWHHLVMVLDREVPGLRGYLDGALIGTDSITSLDSLDNGEIARAGGLGNLLNADLDEVRFLDRPVSSDWVAVDHASGADTLVTVGEPEAVE